MAAVECLFLADSVEKIGDRCSSGVAPQQDSGQLWLIFGDGVNQAADLASGATSIPSRNLTPLMTFGN